MGDVSADDLEWVSGSIGGIPVEAVERDPDQDACSDGTRTDCTSPMRTGTVIEPHAGDNCTMGYHVLHEGSAAFLTSGHCGWETIPTWSHAGITLGVQRETLFVEDGHDAQVVAMPAGQQSDLVFGNDRQVLSWRNPSVGEEVCTTLGAADTAGCGTVSAVGITWQSSSSGYTMNGFRSTLSAIDGDSGSPMYVRDGDNAVATGVLATQGGSGAPMTTVMNNLDLVLAP